MKGKNIFTESELNQLSELIKIRNGTERSRQKGVRDKMRAIGFYGRDDWGITDLEISDLEKLIRDGKIKIADNKAILLAKTHSSSVTKISDISPLTNHKTSFYPISDSDTVILILGTMPGDKSLELGEYYGHSRNNFWRIISAITANGLPLNYFDKKALLLKSKIGIWDVAHKANRKGSLDSAIKNETPNDLTSFISKHKKLKIIGFNGQKAEKLHDKYFDRVKNIEYISLPSTSPANTGISFDELCEKWQQILKKTK